MPTETNEDALEFELNAAGQLDAGDARAPPPHTTVVWGERVHDSGVPLRKVRKRRQAGTEAEMVCGDDDVTLMAFNSGFAFS